MDALALLKSFSLLIFMGFLASSIIPKLTPDARTLSGAAEILRTHIRYAQIQAQACQKQFGIISSGNIEYFMFHNTLSEKIPLPGTDTTYQLRESITISDFVLSFNRSGQPCSDFAGSVPMSNDLVITLQDGGECETVVVSAISGFVT